VVQSCFPSLAASPLSAAARGALAVLAHGHHAWTTSPLKTRVGVSRPRASGRLSRQRRFRSMFTPGSRACAYRTASGRAKWLNRDPIEERGGINLYGFVANNPVNWIDSDGRIVPLLIIGGAAVALGAWTYACQTMAINEAQELYDSTSKSDPDFDKKKHCYTSCKFNRCMLLAPGATLLGGLVHEVFTSNSLSRSVQDEKANLYGIYGSYSFESCEDWCDRCPVKGDDAW